MKYSVIYLEHGGGLQLGIGRIGDFQGIGSLFPFQLAVVAEKGYMLDFFEIAGCFTY